MKPCPVAFAQVVASSWSWVIWKNWAPSSDQRSACGDTLQAVRGHRRHGVLAEPGTAVTAGQPILVLEAMKMEQTVSAPADGVLAELHAKAGDQVSTGQVLAVLRESSDKEG